MPGDLRFLALVFVAAAWACAGPAPVVAPGADQQAAPASVAAAVAEPQAQAEAPLPAGPRALKLATWNIYWLTTRDARGRREASDYERLRRYAQSLAPDIVALQEVDGPKAAELVFDPQVYRFHFAGGTELVQRAGFAWKRDLNVQPNPDLEGLAIQGRRAGADVTLHEEGRSLRLLSVHLKSGCADGPLDASDEECRILRAQLPVVEAWVDARAHEGVPFVVLGDFNRAFTPRDEFWRALDDGDPPGADLHDAAGSTRPACWGGMYPRFIDHIVLSPLAAARVAPHSFHEARFDAPRALREQLSDHCALSVTLLPRAAAARAAISTSPKLTPAEAAAHVGRPATVCGRVDSTRFLAEGNRMTFLNLGGAYPDQAFTVVIRAADRDAFDEPERKLRLRRICVSGVVESYRGKPQIVARSRDQLEVVTEE